MRVRLVVAAASVRSPSPNPSLAPILRGSPGIPGSNLISVPIRGCGKAGSGTKLGYHPRRSPPPLEMGAEIGFEPRRRLGTRCAAHLANQCPVWAQRATQEHGVLPDRTEDAAAPRALAASRRLICVRPGEESFENLT